MAPVVHICLALVIIIASSLNPVDADYKKYVSLITEVREHYGTSSVFFIFSRNNQRMQEYTIVHLLTRIFSKRGVSTLISIFPSLNTRINSYKNRMNPPLIVVMLRTMEDIVEFDNSVEAINKSYPIWLVIFRGSAAGQPFCDYCNNPVGNMFSLRFDTLMLVVCCGNSIVQQWWSVRENHTEFYDFANWRPNEGFKLMDVEQLNAKRHDVCGTALRLSIIPKSPLIHDHGYRIGGFYGQVLNELRIAMNFTIKSMRRLETYGSYNVTSKRWSGGMELLARGETDISFADYTISDSRLGVVDFSFPMLTSSFKLFIKRPDHSDVQWTAYFKVFTLESWLGIIVLIVTSPILLAIIKEKKISVSIFPVVIEKFLCTWGIFCQQGLLEFPAEMPLKLAYSSIFISSLVLFAMYSASLTSFATLSATNLPFKNLEEFIADKMYKLVVFQQSADYDFISNSNAPIAVGMMKKMKPLQGLPANSKEAWHQVCNEKVALYTSVLVKKMTPNIDCPVVGIDSKRVESVAIALPANSQYTKVVNYHIERFKGNGMFKRLEHEYYVRNKQDLNIPSHTGVEFPGIVPIIAVLTGGIILAFFVLLCEIMYYNVNKRKRYSPRMLKGRFIRNGGKPT